MLPAERKNQIREFIQLKKVLKISELSEWLDVSEMTIYRDIKPLINEGEIIKIPGGISLAEKKSYTTSDQTACVYCYKPNHTNSKMVYRLILSNDEIETACCAHCGLLRQRQLNEEAVHAICHDFFMNTTITASLAWYVMDTSLNIACCQPQVLTFENRVHADKFVKGFDGTVLSFQDAMDKVVAEMKGDCHG